MDVRMETNDDEEEAIPVTILEMPEGLSQEHGSLIIDENSSLAPVIIEELIEDEVTMMDVNMDEFIEAEAYQVHQVSETISENVEDELEPELSDEEENDVLTPEEEDRLTKQFLNGELTFSEYSSMMDKDVDVEDKGTKEPEPPKDHVVEKKEKKIIQQKPEELSPKRKKRDRRPRRALPIALQGLMGEANVRFARGDIQTANKMCMEIIRQCPSAPDPYQLLSMIYETEDPEKALQFSLIGAHLSPKDADQWCRLATISVDAGNIKQALTCYSKAIQASPKDITLYEARAELQEGMGEKRARLKNYLKLIHHLGPEDSHQLMEMGKKLTKEFILENNNEQALESMEQIFKNCTDLITLEEVNIITELLITLKKFHQCMEILTKHTGIRVTYKEDTNDSTVVTNQNEKTIESCEVPDSVVVDLKAKFIVTLIELNYVELSDELSKKILNDEDPEDSGDLFLDIAEALMGKKEFKRALKFLDPLVNSKNYSLAAVWLRYAECWVGCKQLKRALLCYEIVTKLSPHHLEAILQLSTLYKCFGFYKLAIDILNQDPEVEVLDSDALYRKSMILLKIEDYEGFLKSGMLLLLKHCVSLRAKSELSTLMRPSVRQRREALQLHRLSLAEPFEDENLPTFSNSDQPSIKDEFNMFMKMCRVAYKLKKFGLLQRLCFTALTSKRFEENTAYIIFLCLLSCIYNNDSYHGYNLVRDLVRDCRKSNLWNLLNIIIQKSDDTRHNRFIMRLLSREDAFSYLQILHANNCLVSGTYKYALNDYVSLFKNGPSALLSLLISVTFLQMACQKFSAKKHQLVTQAFAFFKKYQRIRGADMKQETNYNIARALHQLGLVSGAVHFYKLVLNAPLSKLVQDNYELLDLKKQAAFNLHLVYMQSGNPDLARIYLEEYIVI